MIAEPFFTGITRNGRELRLFSVDEAIRGTLDGVPIEVYAATKAGGGFTVRTDEGTFTAVAEDADADHRDVLRAHLEYKTSGGYQVTLIASAPDPEGTRFTVKITNGRLIAQADFILSPQVTQTVARGADAPTDEQVVGEIAAQIRQDSWDKIEQRAESPTTFLEIAHPSEDY